MTQSHDNKTNKSFQINNNMNTNFIRSVNEAIKNGNDFYESFLPLNKPDANISNSEVLSSTNIRNDSFQPMMQVSSRASLIGNVSQRTSEHNIYHRIQHKDDHNPLPLTDTSTAPSTVVSNQPNKSKTRSSATMMTLNNSNIDSKSNVESKINTPNANDVLFGRGGGINSHPGNISFRQVVKGEKEKYNLASTKAEKANISQQIVNLIHSRGGRFLSVCPGKNNDPGHDIYWMEVDANKAMAKTSQALREGAPEIRALHNQQQKRQKQTPKKAHNKNNQHDNIIQNIKSKKNEQILLKRKESDSVEQENQVRKHDLEGQGRIQNSFKKPKVTALEKEEAPCRPSGLSITAITNGPRGKCIVRSASKPDPSTTNISFENDTTKCSSNQTNDNNSQKDPQMNKIDSLIMFPLPLPITKGLEIPNHDQNYERNVSEMPPTLIMPDDEIVTAPIPTNTKSPSSITTHNSSIVNQDLLSSMNLLPRIPSFTTHNLVMPTNNSNNKNKPLYRANSLAFSDASYELFNAEEEFSNPFAEEDDLLRN